MARLLLASMILFACPGCWTIDTANLQEIGEKYELRLTEGECTEAEIRPLACIQVAKGGFYLLGLIPIVSIGLSETVEELGRVAVGMDADGVCDIRYHYSPPNPLKFLVFPIPDWSAGIQVFGMAYKRVDSSAGRDRPGAPHAQK